MNEHQGGQKVPRRDRHNRRPRHECGCSGQASSGSRRRSARSGPADRAPRPLLLASLAVPRSATMAQGAQLILVPAGGRRREGEASCLPKQVVVPGNHTRCGFKTPKSTPTFLTEMALKKQTITCCLLPFDMIHLLANRLWVSRSNKWSTESLKGLTDNSHQIRL